MNYIKVINEDLDASVTIKQKLMRNTIKGKFHAFFIVVKVAKTNEYISFSRKTTLLYEI